MALFGMDMSNPTYVLGVIVAVVLIAALVVFVLWLLCPSKNTCEEEATTECKKSCGFSGSGEKACEDAAPAPKTCCTKTCGGISGSSGWSGMKWFGFGDIFSGKIGEKCVTA
jgi:hypothetical protein